MVVYGHEHGLRLVWYAGRGFKTQANVPAPKVNGTSKNDPMVIDLDDDDDEPATTDKPAAPAEFEEEEEEVDPSAPYRDVIRYIDIPLGTAASQIAVPHIPSDTAQASPGTLPSIYEDHIVVVAACTDLTIRVISAPLDPPAANAHEISQMDIHIVKMMGSNSHQQFVSDVAITHTGAVTTEESVETQKQQSKPQTRSQSQSKQADEEGDNVKWSLLVASISCTGSGLLLIHQIPLQKNKIVPTPESSIPVQRTFLRAPSMSAKLSFNPSAHPAERHSTLLVTLPQASAVQVYQIFPPHTRERRGSTATNDSVSTTRSTKAPGTDRGKFLISFLPPFSQEDIELGQRRKRVLDAKWVAGGRAVVALLEDGEWGIWDLEAVGPTSSSSGANLIRGQGNISGIHGGSLTKFAIRSSILPSVETKPKSSTSEPQPTSGSLVPMTPSTRKTRSEGLFQGSTLGNGASQAGVQQQGAIYVEEKPSTRSSYDESVVLNFADENIYLPSVLSFWKNETKPLRLPPVKLGGQPPRSISLLPTSQSSDESFGTAASVFGTTPAPPDFLIQTPHRLVLSLNPLSAQPVATDASTQTALVPSERSTLLESGDLDLDDMDRILDNMAGDADSGAVGGRGARSISTTTTTKKPLNLFTKSVGFRIDDEEEEGDGDVDMAAASPTPSRVRGSRLSSGRSTSAFGSETPVPKRRIFT